MMSCEALNTVIMMAALAGLAVVAVFEGLGIFKLASMLKQAKIARMRMRMPAQTEETYDASTQVMKREATIGRMRIYGPLAWTSGAAVGGAGGHDAVRLVFGPSEGDANLSLAADIASLTSSVAQVVIINGVVAEPDAASVRVDRENKIVSIVLRRVASADGAVHVLPVNKDSLDALVHERPRIAFVTVSR